jgi:tyrosinase
VVWIASLFNDPNNKTESEQYQRAAREFALPYWEWAANPPEGGPIYPDDFGQHIINVHGPNGWQTIPNPLFSYHFSEANMQRFPYPTVG